MRGVAVERVAQAGRSVGTTGGDPVTRPITEFPCRSRQGVAGGVVPQIRQIVPEVGDVFSHAVQEPGGLSIQW